MIVVVQLLGFALIAFGILAIARRKTSWRTRFGPWQEYEGRSAVIIGFIMIAFGVATVILPFMLG